MRKLLAVAVMGAAAGLAGCTTVSTVGLARTLDKGEVQVALAPSVGNLFFGYPFPQTDLALRYGVTDNVELGGRVWLLGAAVTSKFGLLRSDGENGLDLALAPSAGYSLLLTEGGATQVELPLLMGINFGGHQLVLGPKVVGQTVPDDSTGSFVQLSVGSSFGFSLKLSNNFRLLPELVVLYPVNYAATNSGPNLVYQVSLGFIFGGYRERRKPLEENPGGDEARQRAARHGGEASPGAADEAPPLPLPPAPPGPRP